ncbi:MAG: T9SS type A sorting domain-containing protein [Balneolaceae bacterium]
MTRTFTLLPIFMVLLTITTVLPAGLAIAQQLEYKSFEKKKTYSGTQKIYERNFDLSKKKRFQKLLNSKPGQTLSKGKKSLEIGNSIEDWTLLYDTPMYISPGGIHFVSDNIGWTYTYSEIAKTTDGGSTWNSQHLVGLDSEPSSLFFIDENTGWALIQNYDDEQDYILHTDDGGSNWTEIQVERLNVSGLGEMFFTDENTGWLVGSYYDGDLDGGIVLKTEDAGENWSVIHQNDNSFNLNKVQFLNENTGWIANDQKILFTDDGGDEWVELYNIDSIGFDMSDKYLELIDLEFMNLTDGWMLVSVHYYNGESYSYVFNTADGGENWDAQAYSDTYLFHELQFIDETNGWILSENATANTTDGENWQLQLTDSVNNYNTMHFSDVNTGWIAGDGRLIKTEDNGENWDEVYNEYSQYFWSFHFINSQKGWAASAKIIQHSSDGGETWEVQYSDDNAYIESVFFSDENTGWAVGEYYEEEYYETGLLLVTKDGGETWSRHDLGLDNYSYSYLYDVVFSDVDHGWIVGGYDDYDDYGDLILYTSDGGETWQRDESDYDADFVYFRDELNGWILGDETIQKTSNGGNTWNLQFDKNDYGFLDISMNDQDNGWVVGYYENDDDDNYSTSPVILGTSNGGELWEEIELEELDYDYVELYGVDFVDESTGYAVGYYQNENGEEGGVIFSTNDGGETWDREIVQNSFFLSVQFNNGSGWLGGEDLYKYESQGTSVENDKFVSHYILNQNYPNPFNPSTMISYQLPVNSEVSLKVFDMLGREVGELANGQKAAGTHTAHFDASNLSSGMYIYRLQAGSFTQTRKLMLIK